MHLRLIELKVELPIKTTRRVSECLWFGAAYAEEIGMANSLLVEYVVDLCKWPQARLHTMEPHRT